MATLPADPIAQATEDLHRTIAESQLHRAKLSIGEVWWRDHQAWLQERGYMLRPRYRPGWVPSWDGKPGMNPSRCEDGVRQRRKPLMDVTRISDGKTVMLKRVMDTTHPYELEINRLLCSEPYISHPRNHCAPIYEFMDVPDEEHEHIIVMPLLRPFDQPSFETVGEAAEFFHQIFEGLHFMHQCHVAHRDCMDMNIMMESLPLFPKLFHPQHVSATVDLQGLAKPRGTRTEQPVNYYLIDFGLSGIYDPHKGETFDLPVFSGDKTVPKFRSGRDQLQDVYPTDVYYIGNMVRGSFLQKYVNLEFMQSLVDDMVQDDPKKRPTMDEVVKRFAEIRQQIPWWKLRSRLTKEGGWTKSAKHVLRTIGYMATFRSAVPSPSR